MLQAAADDASGLDDDWVRAQSLFSLAITLQEDAAQMRAMLEEALALFRTLDDGLSIALALTPLGDLALLEGDVPRGTAMHEEALSWPNASTTTTCAQSLDQLALDAMLAGDVVLARSRLTAAAELHRQVRDQEGPGTASTALPASRSPAVEPTLPPSCGRC